MKKLFCCPALELFHCLPLWKTVLFVSSRAFLLSTPTFLFSTSVEKSEATWKIATKCNKLLLRFTDLYRRKYKQKTHFLKGGLDGFPTHLYFLKCKDPSTYERKSLIYVKSHVLPNLSTRLIKSRESKLLLSV